ncbi:hypothetical protein OF83DRAFT_1027581, partial [Amylostereum chailletii]
ADAQKETDFFREQYMTASAFVTESTEENKRLSELATTKEGQARDGVAGIRAFYEGRIRRLEEDVSRHKATADLLAERGRRTDDEVRSRAALVPELMRQNVLLEEKADLQGAELEDLKEEMEGLRKKNARRKREL